MDNEDDSNESKKHTLDTSDEIEYKKVTIKMKLNQIEPRPDVKDLIENFVEKSTFVMHYGSLLLNIYVWQYIQNNGHLNNDISVQGTQTCIIPIC